MARSVKFQFVALLLLHVSHVDAAEPADSADRPLADRVGQLEHDLFRVRQQLRFESGAATPQTAWETHTPLGESCPPGYALPPVADCADCVTYPTVRVTGVFHADAAWFHQSPNNRATVGDIDDGAGFRRTRLAATGNVTANTSYIIEMDFAAGLPLFFDVWANVSQVPGLGNVRVGRWRQPFGMDELTSVRELPFLERSTVFAFAPFRQTGVGFFNHSDNERLTWALSGYRYPTDNFGNTSGDNGGYGLAGRVTMLPYYEDEGESLLHFGVDYSFNDPARDLVRFSSTPEIRDGQSVGGLLPAPFDGNAPFVDTGDMPTNYLNQFGLEAAAAMGSLYLQSEARWTVVDFLNGATETFPGAYAQARYVLTGEKLPYNQTAGVFGRIVPYEDFNFCGGHGAWELAARWSYIDLNGSGLPGPGRRLNDLTLGLNWYLSQFTKLQFNYIQAFLNDPLRDDSDASIVAARAQLDF